jgi:hypothetical protein
MVRGSERMEIPFYLQNPGNFLEISCGPLSNMICLGNPKRPNDSNRKLIVLSAEMEPTGVFTISGHLEWASIMMNHIHL